MGEPQTDAEPQTQADIAVAPICQHEIFALAERLGFTPQDHVQEITLASGHIDVTTIDADEKGQLMGKQVDGHQEPVVTTHRFAYSHYGTAWNHSHE
jgi:hypothetical protein